MHCVQVASNIHMHGDTEAEGSRESIDVYAARKALELSPQVGV